MKIQIKNFHHLLIFYLSSCTFFKLFQILKATDNCDTTFQNFDKEKTFECSRETSIFNIQSSNTENELSLGEKVKKQLKCLKNQKISQSIN